MEGGRGRRNNGIQPFRIVWIIKKTCFRDRGAVRLFPPLNVPTATTNYKTLRCICPL